jgi:hypothetical protein
MRIGREDGAHIGVAHRNEIGIRRMNWELVSGEGTVFKISGGIKKIAVS